MMLINEKDKKWIHDLFIHVWVDNQRTMHIKSFNTLKKGIEISIMINATKPVFQFHHIGHPNIEYSVVVEAKKVVLDEKTIN